MPLINSIRRAVARWLLAFAAISVSYPALAAPPGADHPLVGTWRIDMRDGSCHEIYRFRADGTSMVTSAGQIAETEFDVSPSPSAKGFFKWMDTIREDNGKADCLGGVSEIGQHTTHFIRFHPSRNVFFVCMNETLDECIGPFVRQRGQDA